MDNPCYALDIAIEELMANCSREVIEPFDLNKKAPLKYALPIYGYWMPIMSLVTLVTNTFIVVVLSKKHLRTPTNTILMGMAITETLTGISSLPVTLHHYTLGGHNNPQIDPLWCVLFPICLQALPTVFHTSAVWLTVFLTVQRYVYVCSNNERLRDWCTKSRTKKIILIICFVAFLVEVFHVANFHWQPRIVYDHVNGTNREFCMQYVSSFLAPKFHIYLQVRGIFKLVTVHVLPCAVIIIFTIFLVNYVRKADVRREQLLNGTRTYPANDQQEVSRRSKVLLCFHSAICSRASEVPESDSFGADSIPFSEPPYRRTTGQSLRGNGSGHQSTSSHHGTTRMLIVIVLLFLITALPAAILNGVHIIWMSAFRSITSADTYYVFNVLLLLRNALILTFYPVNFAIYCGMSNQFRETVKELFRPNTRRTRARSNIDGKRYSLVTTNTVRTTPRNPTTSVL